MTLAQALAAIIAGEDAAIYAYEVAGARVPTGRRQAARTGLDVHRANRSTALSLLLAAGGTAPAPAAAYTLPGDVTRPAGARAALATVDNALVPVYADAAAALAAADRRWAARAAVRYATAAVDWGARPQAFPT